LVIIYIISKNIVLTALLIAIQIYTQEGLIPYWVLYQDPDFIVIKTESQETVAIFYGTDSIMEWVDNFRFGLLNKDGFPLGWYNVAINAFQNLYAKGIKPDYVIGYSRGAAIALIYSYYFNVQAVGFSTPRVNKNLVYWGVKPVLIGSLNDPVRHVPIGYKLPGAYTAVYLESGGHFWSKDKYTLEVKTHLIDPKC
jgi:hypothetical protein